MPGQNRRSRAGRRQSGATAVEFGLIVLPLFYMLFGIIQYGFYFWSMQAGSNAVRDAARYSAVGTLSCGDLQSRVEDLISAAGRDEDGDDIPDVTVTRQFGTIDPTDPDMIQPADPKIGDTVRVKIAFKSFEIGLIPIPNNAVVVQSADSRVENVTSISGDCDESS